MTRREKHLAAFDHVWVVTHFLPERKGQRLRILQSAGPDGFLRVQFEDGWILRACDPTYIERREGMGAR